MNCAVALLTFSASGAALFAQPAPAVDIARCVDALRDDDLRCNALHATRTLWQSQELARPALMEALDSSDWQQRQYAFLLLTQDPGAHHTSSMIRVAIEALHNDRMGAHVIREPGEPNEVWDNAAQATRYLIRVGRAAEAPLAEALGKSSDAQQRFLAAYCLGMMGSSIAVEPCAAELLPHLRDNDIQFDAVMATPALYRLGPAVIPSLLRARDMADRQQGEMIDLLLLDLTHPPTTNDELVARKGMQSITKNSHDPAIEIHFQQMFHGPLR